MYYIFLNSLSLNLFWRLHLIILSKWPFLFHFLYMLKKNTLIWRIHLVETSVFFFHLSFTWRWKVFLTTNTNEKSESRSVVSDSLQPHGLQSMEFSRPEYWSGWPFPSPGHLPNSGIKRRSPALQVDSLPAQPPGKPKRCHNFRGNRCFYDFTFVFVLGGEWCKNNTTWNLKILIMVIQKPTLWAPAIRIIWIWVYWNSEKWSFNDATLAHGRLLKGTENLRLHSEESKEISTEKWFFKSLWTQIVFLIPNNAHLQELWCSI